MKKCLVCSKEFHATPSDVKIGKAKYCSQSCYYKSKKGKSNIKLSILYKGKHKEWLDKIRPDMKNENHPMWKGDQVGYVGLHIWIRRRLAKPLGCNHCGESKPLDLANKSHEYKRDLDDWLWLCKSCHSKYDMTPEKKAHLAKIRRRKYGENRQYAN